MVYECFLLACEIIDLSYTVSRLLKEFIFLTQFEKDGVILAFVQGLETSREIF